MSTTKAVNEQIHITECNYCLLWGSTTWGKCHSQTRVSECLKTRSTFVHMYDYISFSTRNLPAVRRVKVRPYDRTCIQKAVFRGDESNSLGCDKRQWKGTHQATGLPEGKRHQLAPHRLLSPRSCAQTENNREVTEDIGSRLHTMIRWLCSSGAS